MPAKIVDALGDISQSTVLEIGPGRGILTSLLAKRARRLIAVELDRVLAAQLRLQFSMARNVEIIEADILSIDFDSLFGPKPGLGRPASTGSRNRCGWWAICLTTSLPIFLLRLFEYREIFREHCDHGAARSGRPHRGRSRAAASMECFRRRLSFMLAWRKLVYAYRRTAFVPPPKVHSTCCG
jgi:16S rRNA A1518/A1519 N6-dimethyltransferase RsmA/KsgA/DIM1 with predicted DNA glycosylase/AP lyase activity